MKTNISKVENVLRNDYFIKFPKDAAHTLDKLPTDSILDYLKLLPSYNAKEIFFNLNAENITALLLKMNDSLFRDLFAKSEHPIGCTFALPFG